LVKYFCNIRSLDVQALYLQAVAALWVSQWRHLTSQLPGSDPTTLPYAHAAATRDAIWPPLLAAQVYASQHLRTSTKQQPPLPESVESIRFTFICRYSSVPIMATPPDSPSGAEDLFDPSVPFKGVVVCCTSIPPEQRVRLSRPPVPLPPLTSPSTDIPYRQKSPRNLPN